MKLKRDLTTGQVAKICGVAPRTVSQWVDSGALRDAFRLPNSQDRRIPREALIRFLREKGMPLYGLVEDGVTVISDDESLVSQLRAEVNGSGAFRSDKRPFEAFACLQSHPTSRVLIDTNLGYDLARTLVTAVRGIHPSIRVIAVTQEDQNGDGIEDAHRVYRRPAMDIHLLVADLAVPDEELATSA